MSKKTNNLFQNAAEHVIKTSKHHFDSVNTTESHRLSTGSLRFDRYLSGGFPPGFHNLYGESHSGKTSLCCHLALDFLDKHPNGQVLYVDAEGRLGGFVSEIFEKSKYKVANQLSEWESRSIFIHRNRCVEDIAIMIHNLCTASRDECDTNEENDDFEQTKLFIVIDSLDVLTKRDFLENPFKKVTNKNGEEFTLPPGKLSRIIKEFFTTCGLSVQMLGHYCFLISQVSDSFTIQKEAKRADNRKDINASGGNSVIHNCDTILEFIKARRKDDYVRNDENEVIGRKIDIQIKKNSLRDNSKENFSYEIIKDGNGLYRVYTEEEIFETFMKYGLVTKAGSWIKFSQKVRDSASEKGIEIPEQTQGKAKFCTMLEDEEILNFLKDWASRLIDSESELDVA